MPAQPRRDVRVGGPDLLAAHTVPAAADVALDAAVLDRIDEIVRPSVDLNPADTSHGEHLLEPAVRRRE